MQQIFKDNKTFLTKSKPPIGLFELYRAYPGKGLAGRNVLVKKTDKLHFKIKGGRVGILAPANRGLEEIDGLLVPPDRIRNY